MIERLRKQFNTYAYLVSTASKSFGKNCNHLKKIDSRTAIFKPIKKRGSADNFLSRKNSWNFSISFYKHFL